MRKLTYGVGILFTLLTMVFQSCQEEIEIQPENEAKSRDVHSSFQQQIIGEIPDATISLKTYPSVFSTTSMITAAEMCESALSPETFSATLQAEETTSESLTACLDGIPTKGDVLFIMDLTASMAGELNNMKVNSINIMNSVRASIPDSQFGVVSFMDYPEIYESCGYSATYGGPDDYPYLLGQPITETTDDVSAAINNLSLGYGSDQPESAGRALYETYSDSDIGWRDGAARIIIMITDAGPHDCNIPNFFSLSSGVDPGRDGVAETADDIAMDDVISQLQSNGSKLIVLESSGDSQVSTIWENFASATGGSSFSLNTAGTIPSGEEIDVLLTNLVEESVSTINTLTLSTFPNSFGSWLTNLDPVSYSNIELDSQQNFEFDVDFTVPAGTPDGVYEFDLVLNGDGANFGTQAVTITVQSDSDGDGCDDDEDPFPNSNTDDTITIDGCDSGVANQFVDECTTMMDLISECIENATSHGDLVSCVSGLTNSWKRAGLISGRDKGKIIRCAGQANLP